MSVLDTYTPFLGLPSDQLIALAAYGEAGGEGIDGMMAVINVITNRVYHYNLASGWYSPEIYNYTGDIWKAVVLAPKQFSAFNLNDAVRPKLENLAYNFDYYASTLPILNQAWQLAQMAVAGTLEDNTGGATNYFNPYIVQPSWAAAMDYLGQLGNHVFYTVLPFSQRVRDVTAQIGQTIVSGGETVLATFSEAASSPATWVLLPIAIFLGLKLYKKRRRI